MAVPFRQAGSDALEESAFVVALSLDRDWFSPDQAKRLVDVAVTEDLLAREDGEVAVQFDAGAVEVPADFEPDESVLRRRSAFERVLEAVVDGGVEKRQAVADINRLQGDLGVTIEAAAVVYARRRSVDVGDHADAALEAL